MAVIGVPLINGVSYAHADIVLNILGRPIPGVTSISYSDLQEITNNYGTGYLPTSRGFGPVNLEASLTLTSEEVQRLTEAAPGGRIQNIPDFDIGVNFVTEAGNFCRHKLVRARFKGRSLSSQTNNSQIEETLELSVVDINYNA